MRQPLPEPQLAIRNSRVGRWMANPCWGRLKIGRAPARARPVQDSPAIANVKVEDLTIAVHLIATLAPTISHVPCAAVLSGGSYSPVSEVSPRAHREVLPSVRRDEHAQAAGAERVAG